MRALSIMYHDVVENGEFESSGFPGEDANVYKLRREDFEQQLEAIGIAAAKDTIATIAERREWSGAAPVFLTFDDGGSTCSSVIAELLEKRGWRGHFFVTTGRIGQRGFVSEADVRDLHKRGHVIGSHSDSHPTRMAALAQAQMDAEWRESLARLSGIIGKSVRVASVPGGYYSREVGVSAAAAGIQVLFTSEPTASARVVDGCLILGRYVVMRGMGPRWAAGFAGGWRGPRWRQTALWKAKGAAKALGGSAYLRLRNAILERRA